MDSISNLVMSGMRLRLTDAMLSSKAFFLVWARAALVSASSFLTDANDSAAWLSAAANCLAIAASGSMLMFGQ